MHQLAYKDAVTLYSMIETYLLRINISEKQFLRTTSK